MEEGQQRLSEGRADTDARLFEERAASDAGDDLDAVSTRQTLDDLIERDRIFADAKLQRYRNTVDSRLSRKRSDSPPPNDSVASERDSADRCKFVEREMSDLLLEAERQRSDVAVGKEREEHDTLPIGQEARRQATDDQLSSERLGVDVTVTALGATRHALAHAHREQLRLDDALSFVAHDLRSPLTIISISAETIADSTRETATRLTALRATRAVARMDRLLTDLLDVVRIQAGALTIRRRQHDIGTLMADVFGTYVPLFAARGIAFTINTWTDPIIVSIDYDRIVQVLSNLLGNAMKFTPHGGSATLHVQREPQQVEISLQDNGPGVHANALPHVFERFWQIDSDARRGLGLGLYICQEIVEAHGGRIWVESDFGNGATFRLTLPLGGGHDDQESGRLLPQTDAALR
jgi:signal transduction histidine kinase